MSQMRTDEENKMVSRLNDIIGIDVFAEDGMHVGTLEDVSIDPETGKVLGIVLNNVKEGFMKIVGIEATKGIVVPYGAVRSVGDIVLMKTVAYRQSEEEEA